MKISTFIKLYRASDKVNFAFLSGASGDFIDLFEKTSDIPEELLEYHVDYWAYCNGCIMIYIKE